jgi:hypothetical protein
MSIVSEIMTVESEGRLRSYLTTNVGTERFLSYLKRRGILESAETVHAYFGDRAEGGSGYEILWKSHIRWADLVETFRKL